MAKRNTFVRVKRFKQLSPPTLNSEIKPCTEESKAIFKELSTVFKSNIKVSRIKPQGRQAMPLTSRTKYFNCTTKPSHHLSLSIHSTSKTPRSSRVRVSSISSLCAANILPEYPLTPAESIEYFREALTDVEISEVIEYNQIWYLAAGVQKVKNDILAKNFGFDNDKGDYKIIIGDHIQFRYQILSVLGTGSFGQVCKCLDHRTKEIVAIKILKNKRKFYKQGLVEVKLLQRMKDEDPKNAYNIVNMRTNFVFRNHLCISFELLSINLYELMKLNKFQPMPLPLIRKFAVQILKGLEYTSSLKIIHCDLKPENILLKDLKKSNIKLIDFGSGCYEFEQIYTYIQSRFYRAPEIMLGIPYTSSIDIWSFFCVIVELHIGFPLFPGESEFDQFLRIMEVLGPPPTGVLEKSTRKKKFFESGNRPRVLPNSKGKIRVPGGRRLEEIIGCGDMEFLRFVRSGLVWDPLLRTSAAEALMHPWVLNSEKISEKKKFIGRSFIDPRDFDDL